MTSEHFITANFECMRVVHRLKNHTSNETVKEVIPSLTKKKIEDRAEYRNEEKKKERQICCEYAGERSSLPSTTI